MGLVALSWTFIIAHNVSLQTFAPDFMMEMGLSLKSAGFDASLILAGPLLLCPIVGYAVDRIGRPEAFLAAGGIGMASLVLLIPSGGSHLAALMVALGICSALNPPPIYSLTADVVGQGRLGLGFGVLSISNNIGIFLGPQLVGLSRDAMGSYTTGFRLMALFAVLSVLITAVLWAKRRRHEASIHP